MACMYVSLVELPLLTAMGRICILDLSGVRGLLPYLRGVMTAPIPQGRGASRFYRKSGSPRVGWLDARVPLLSW
jgi:hypothetical protein